MHMLTIRDCALQRFGANFTFTAEIFAPLAELVIAMMRHHPYVPRKRSCLPDRELFRKDDVEVQGLHGYLLFECIHLICRVGK